eukprot:1161798-Pelagomonas_calceolata.AAC.7
MQRVGMCKQMHTPTHEHVSIIHVDKADAPCKQAPRQPTCHTVLWRMQGLEHITFFSQATFVSSAMNAWQENFEQLLLLQTVTLETKRGHRAIQGVNLALPLPRPHLTLLNSKMEQMNDLIQAPSLHKSFNCAHHDQEGQSTLKGAKGSSTSFAVVLDSEVTFGLGGIAICDSEVTVGLGGIAICSWPREVSEFPHTNLYELSLEPGAATGRPSSQSLSSN